MCENKKLKQNKAKCKKQISSIDRSLLYMLGFLNYNKI